MTRTGKAPPARGFKQARLLDAPQAGAANRPGQYRRDAGQLRWPAHRPRTAARSSWRPPVPGCPSRAAPRAGDAPRRGHAGDLQTRPDRPLGHGTGSSSSRTTCTAAGLPVHPVRHLRRLAPPGRGHHRRQDAIPGRRDGTRPDPRTHPRRAARRPGPGPQRRPPPAVTGDVLTIARTRQARGGSVTAIAQHLWHRPVHPLPGAPAAAHRDTGLAVGDVGHRPGRPDRPGAGLGLPAQAPASRAGLPGSTGPGPPPWRSACLR